MNEFKLCPMCGGKNITSPAGRKWFCPDCNFELYNNVAAAVGLVISDSTGRVLFERRAKDPRKGFLAFPGGFVDPDESAEEAAVRECMEETGVKPASLEYLCSFPNTYVFNKITYKTCDIFFKAVLPPDAELTPQPGEVDAFERIKIQKEEDIETIPLAFESARKTLKLWLKTLK